MEVEGNSREGLRMKKKNLVLRIAGLLLAAVAVVFAVRAASSVLGGRAAELVYEKRDYAVGAEGIREFRVRARNMPVTVTAEEGGGIVIHYATCEEDPYEVTLEGGVLTLACKNDALTTVSQWFSGIFRVFSRSNPEVGVVLPANYAGKLSLDTSNAPVDVSGLTAAGEIRVDSSNAPVTVSGVSAALLDARTSNGSVTLERMAVSGPADAWTSNGAATARQVVARDRLRMETSNGRVTVEGVASADIQLRSSNGSITGSVEGKRADYTISSHTSNGDDSLGDGGKGQFRLTVQTSNGNIDIRFLGE